MSHLWLERPMLRVETDSDGRPRVVTWRRESHRVDGVIEHWRENRRWWSERHRDRDLWQLVTETGFIMELVYDRHRDEWLLQRIYD